MDSPTVSIVIRTLNEAQSLKELLAALARQINIPREKVEIIVVDNESTDGTQTIARDAGAQVIVLPRKEFSYPRSMNLGVAAATAPIVVLTVGHALPIGRDWLVSLLPHFKDPRVAGVYGSVAPNRRCGFFERLFYLGGYWRDCLFNPRVMRKTKLGVFGATNCALRRELWEIHPFDESYELGGEDTHWAQWAFDQGYVIIREAGFSVRHSHGLSLPGLMAQMRYWKRLDRPTSFDKQALRHRKDIRF